jgi:hypothetical protein
MDSREEIDAQIAALEHQIRELRSRRNATVGLCRLPSELVVRIIKSAYTHPTEGVKDDGLHTYKPSRSFVLSRDEIDARATARTLVMHVCHHLRQVALDACELWSLFNLKRGCDLHRLEAQMALAGESPLTIWAIGATEIAGWVASRLCNAKSARLFLGEDMQELAAALTTPKSVLRQLDIDTTFRGGYPIESNFLGGCCENLTHLSLEWVVINVPPVLPSLVCLRVRDLRGDVWLKGLAALLYQAPRLEELTVVQTHKSASLYNATEIQQPYLPLLREVEVRIRDAIGLHDILRLIPPPQQHFSAAQLSTDDSPEASSEHMYALLNPFWPATTRPIGTLTLSLSSEWHLRNQIIGMITLECKSDTLPRSAPAFSFDIARLNGSDIGPSYWPHIHTLRLPAHSADRLVQESGSSWHGEHLSSLRTLVLLGPLGETDKWTKWTDVLSWLGRRAIAGNTIDTVVYSGSIVNNSSISEMLWFTTADLELLMLGLVQHRVTTADHTMIPVVNRAIWRQQGVADRIWAS